jgi:MFS family permease
MALSITSVVGRLGGGWLSSIISPWRMFMIGLAIQVLAFFLIYAYPQEWSIWTFVIMIGPVYGSSLVLRSIIIRNYFHPGIFGTVQGFVIGIITIGGIIGPMFTGWVFDNNADYGIAWLVMSALTIAALPILAYAKKNL